MSKRMNFLVVLASAGMVAAGGLAVAQGSGGAGGSGIEDARQKADPANPQVNTQGMNSPTATGNTSMPAPRTINEKERVSPLNNSDSRGMVNATGRNGQTNQPTQGSTSTYDASTSTNTPNAVAPATYSSPSVGAADGTTNSTTAPSYNNTDGAALLPARADRN